jgi:glucose-6-phosphate isomerase
MVDVKLFGKDAMNMDLSYVAKQANRISSMIDDKSGEGNDFLGWLDYASKLPESEVDRIIRAAKKIRENFDCLVVCGIGGSYLGARAVIEALNGLFPEDDFEILYLGNTLSSEYTYQVMKHLEKKHFAINCISKSGTTTETAVSFRLLKNLYVKKFGKETLKDAVYATTDKARGALKSEADKEGYECFVIPDDIGGRFSVITPVGLLPIAAAGIDIKEFLMGVIQGEKDYSVNGIDRNPAYYYGALRYLLNRQDRYVSEMFVSYDLQNKMIAEWLKQLFDESEGKDNQALLCSSAIFTTDLHSMGQFIQQGSPVLFETVIKTNNPNHDVVVPSNEENLDNLNYLAGKNLSYINSKAYEATLKAHTDGHTPAIVLSIDKMDAYNLGNMVYFFFRACAFSAYLLGVNPFNQPGVEIYKKNMFTLLGKPGYEKK